MEVKPYCGQSSRTCPSRSVPIKACFPRTRHPDKSFLLYGEDSHGSWKTKGCLSTSPPCRRHFCGAAQAVAISLNLQQHSSQPIGCSDRIERQGNVFWLMLLFFPSGKASPLTSDNLRASSLYSAHPVRLQLGILLLCPLPGFGSRTRSWDTLSRAGYVRARQPACGGGSWIM